MTLVNHKHKKPQLYLSHSSSMSEAIEPTSTLIDKRITRLKEILMKDELRDAVCACISDSINQHLVNTIYNLIDVRKQQATIWQQQMALLCQTNELLTSCAHQLIEHNIDQVLGLTPPMPTIPPTSLHVQEHSDPPPPLPSTPQKATHPVKPLPIQRGTTLNESLTTITKPPRTDSPHSWNRILSRDVPQDP